MTREQFQRKVAHNIREAREQRRISQRELSKLAGMTESYICLLEKGGRCPSMYVFHKICEALGLKMSGMSVGLS